MKFTRTRRPDPFIDITPMIDIVFQLVLFFMVSTTFISSPGFQVDLPRSSAETVVSESKDLNVWMTCGDRLEGGSCTDGPIYLGDQAMTFDELKARFQAAANKDPGTLVVIKADQGVRHGWVVEVMDLARSLGLDRLAIATEPGKPPVPGKPPE